MIKKFIKFLNELNANFEDDEDFQYKIGDVFEYNELPFEIQNDIMNCLISENDTEPEDFPENFEYKVVLISFKKLMEWMDSVFGPELTEKLSDQKIVNIAKEIKKNGLRYPIIFGCEGHHRALAYCLLKKSIPSFKFVKKKDENSIYW